MKYLIYGAYGFTGQLIAKLAKEKKHEIVLAGRDASKTAKVAKQLDYPHLSFDLSDNARLTAALSDVDAVLHCAGPFSKTAEQMINACLATKTHYLDITGEIEVFELAASKDLAAQEAGIVIMPGVGFDVVPSDCLAAYLKGKLPDATYLEMGFKGVSKLSRGTALTMAENMHKGGMIRVNGELQEVPAAYKTREVSILGKQRTFVSIPWGDVSTAYHSTGIPNITIYTGVHPKQVSTMKTLYALRFIFRWRWIQNYIKKKINKTVKGPDENLLNEGRSYLWGEAKNENGDCFFARLETSEGYKLTAITALLAMEKVLSGTVASGFKTPSLAFGPDFILEVEGTTRTDE